LRIPGRARDDALEAGEPAANRCDRHLLAGLAVLHEPQPQAQEFGSSAHPCIARQAAIRERLPKAAARARCNDGE
jgi:hypothetical protein